MPFVAPLCSEVYVRRMFELEGWKFVRDLFEKELLVVCVDALQGLGVLIVTLK